MENISKNKQQGSVQFVAIIILSVALVGALGYIYWSNFMQPKSTTINDAATTSTVTATTTPKPVTSVSPESDSNTIVLSDWKIKMTIPESLRNTSVKYSKNTKNGQDNYGFTTARIEALGGECATQPYGKSILLARTQGTLSNVDVGVVNKTPIGGYTYDYIETIPACSGSKSDSGMVNQVEIDDKAAIVKMLESLETTE